MSQGLDLKNAVDIVIVAGNRKHMATFLERSPRGEMLFRITERDHAYLHSQTGNACQVFATIDRKRIFFRGKVASQTADKAIVFNPTPPEFDRRVASRYTTVSIPATIRMVALLRPSAVPASIMDMTRTGAQISTDELLDTNRDYVLESTLRVRHAQQPFSATCHVRYSRKERGVHVSGMTFEESSLSPEHKETLDSFLSQMGW
jgi:hypothetical protein